VARDAALRGLRVAPGREHDYASGTSSRSSRLVHGGVRYLEHGELGLVFESSRERRDAAAHRAASRATARVHLAGVSRARVPRWKLGAGLLLYDVLSLFPQSGDTSARRARVHASEPALRTEALSAARATGTPRRTTCADARDGALGAARGAVC
jgi:glycerol-3-phosphate dehydrogenase